MTDAHHGAIHGTSLETVKAMIQTGSIPGYSQPHSEYGMNLGDIFAYPTTQLAQTVDTLTDSSISHQMTQQPEESLYQAKSYAEMIAQTHALLTSFGISITDAEARDIASDLFAEGLPDAEIVDRATHFFARKGIEEGRFEAEIAKARERKGVLLGFSPDIAHTPGITITNGDQGSSDIKIITSGRGLPYRYISGIEPMGPVEAEFLRELEQKK